MSLELFWDVVNETRSNVPCPCTGDCQLEWTTCRQKCHFGTSILRGPNFSEQIDAAAKNHTNPRCGPDSSPLRAFQYLYPDQGRWSRRWEGLRPHQRKDLECNSKNRVVQELMRLTLPAHMSLGKWALPFRSQRGHTSLKKTRNYRKLGMDMPRSWPYKLQ